MTRCRSIRPVALLVAATLLAAAPVALAEGESEYLRTKLSFRYVDRPNDITTAPEILDNAAIAAGRETGAFWSATNIPGLQNLVRSLIRNPGSGGDAGLIYVTAETVKILDRPVMILLLNDVRAPLTEEAMAHWDACDDGNGRAWPCASNASTMDDIRERCAQTRRRPAPPRQDAAWAGAMTLGQAVFNGRRAGNPIGTFVHELVHTQDRSDRRNHLFVVSQRAYHYGDDGTHYYTEAVPNLASTYQEGIANAVSMVVDGQLSRRMFDWFSANDVLLVEKTALAPGTGPGPAPCGYDVTTPSADIWLYNQLLTAGAREIRPTRPIPNYAAFRVRSLPPRFIVHNEMIIALVFAEYARHLGLRKVMSALKANDATLFRVCASPIAQLYDQLCRAGYGGSRPLPNQIPGMPFGIFGNPDPGPKPYILPLAYADFFTGFNSRTKEEFASIFESSLSRGWIDLYWDGYKDRVRMAAMFSPSSPPRPEHLTNIATALGITQSLPWDQEPQPDPLGVRR